MESVQNWKHKFVGVAADEVAVLGHVALMKNTQSVLNWHVVSLQDSPET